MPFGSALFCDCHCRYVCIQCWRAFVRDRKSPMVSRWFTSIVDAVPCFFNKLLVVHLDELHLTVLLAKHAYAQRPQIVFLKWPVSVCVTGTWCSSTLRIPTHQPATPPCHCASCINPKYDVLGSCIRPLEHDAINLCAGLHQFAQYPTLITYVIQFRRLCTLLARFSSLMILRTSYF
jgi:hypothetical protein